MPLKRQETNLHLENDEDEKSEEEKLQSTKVQSTKEEERKDEERKIQPLNEEERGTKIFIREVFVPFIQIITLSVRTKNKAHLECLSFNTSITSDRELSFCARSTKK